MYGWYSCLSYSKYVLFGETRLHTANQQVSKGSLKASSKLEDQKSAPNNLVTHDKDPEEESDKPHGEGSPLLQCNKKSASTSRDESTSGTRAPTEELQNKLLQRREREKNKDALEDFESKVFGSKK